MNREKSSIKIEFTENKDSITVNAEVDFEFYETVLTLKEYNKYNCETVEELRAFLEVFVKGLFEKGVSIFTVIESELKIDFVIDLGFKWIDKSIILQKIKKLSEVEKIEIFYLKKLEEKENEIKSLQSKIDKLTSFPVDKKYKVKPSCSCLKTVVESRSEDEIAESFSFENFEVFCRSK